MAFLAPRVIKEVMTQRFQQIATTTNPGRHTLLTMDGVNWHTRDITKDIYT
ncbi:hypothetical protein [Paraglaciecola psychrophila]|uniref:Uncharacterized protein n=1 Tax=Paraglaciecola psychrophila 170 TaxID=1129794 RepID=K7AC56_9ALTE|nr:hypothetical protein [Paraglaciecola psychrophila]AGH42144.1 hypothetical protein C427_0034 [Paraglaciecola psychrophila 170]GAC39832.1 hypothetical protein GPSY_4221 [Paraglaciecola psychrophila 170]